MASNELSENIGFCTENIAHVIENEKRKIENRTLLKICGEYGNILTGEVNPHFCHEIAETALNLIIKRKYARELLTSQDPAKLVSEVLKPLSERLPTQTWRSREQCTWQQFSTPPAIAYLLAYLLNFRTDNKVLEPSAGTGSLAVWASGLGIDVQTNEIDRRRRVLLAYLSFLPTSFDAEFINDFLPEEIAADCLMMNPPFSSSGGRTTNNSSKFGFRHVESALERLRKGGKFGIILGSSAGLDTRAGDEFWRRLSGKYCFKSFIKIAGREYYKNGTSVDVVVITGEKLLEEQGIDWNLTKSRIAGVSARTVEDAFDAVRNLNLRLRQ